MDFSENNNATSKEDMIVDNFQNVFIIIHVVFDLLGAAINATLIYLCIYHSPNIIKRYSLIMLNLAVTDLGACLADLFVINRIIPSGLSLAFIANGPCMHFSTRICFIGNSIMLHFFEHSFYTVIFSFAYRYYILAKAAPKTSNLVLCIVILYLPSFIQGVTYSFAQDDNNIQEIVQGKYPMYDLSRVQIYGISNVISFHALYCILLDTCSVWPGYITIFILRRKIIKRLEECSQHMRDSTRKMHKNLLIALTYQALLPFCLGVTALSYTVGQLGIYNHPFLEYLTFTAMLPVPVINPCLAILFVRPYRLTIIRYLTKQYRISDITLRPAVTSTAKKTSGMNQTE